MGKLNFEERLESLDAIKKLYAGWSKDANVRVRNVRVIDKNTKNTIFDMRVPMNIEVGTEFYKINIMWEDVGITDFNSLKLFGVYWSSYNKMSYDEEDKFLVIDSDGADKLIKVYS